MSLSSLNLPVVAPVITLSLTGFVIVGVSLIWSKVSRHVFLLLSLLGLGLSFWFTTSLWNSNTIAFGGMVVADNYALFFNFIFLISAALSMLLSQGEHEQGHLLNAEYFALMLFATVGMVLMAAGSNLLVLFLGLETLSISLYVLAGIKRTEPKSLEAAFKYFLLGAFSSAFLLYGIAFIYGVTGSLSLRYISNFISSAPLASQPLLLLGGLLVVAGLGFKVVMFPFHMWAPDVYEGAATPVTAFMATGSKAAAFAALLRVLHSLFDGASTDWMVILSVLAVLTMFVGNLAAIAQANVKRMLAYSSVAHAGYVLIGLIAWSDAGTAGVLFYLLVYMFMTVGAFAVLSFLSSRQSEFVMLDDFRGLAFRKPAVALAMAVFMFSLAGLPPTAGFVGKFYLFSAAVKAGHTPLVVFAVVNSVISLYYYLGVVVMMFMRKTLRTLSIPPTVPLIACALLVAVLASCALGLFPSYLMDTIEHFAVHLL